MKSILKAFMISSLISSVALPMEQNNKPSDATSSSQTANVDELPRSFIHALFQKRSLTEQEKEHIRNDKEKKQYVRAPKNNFGIIISPDEKTYINKKGELCDVATQKKVVTLSTKSKSRFSAFYAQFSPDSSIVLMPYSHGAAPTKYGAWDTYTGDQLVESSEGLQFINENKIINTHGIICESLLQKVTPEQLFFAKALHSAYMKNKEVSLKHIAQSQGINSHELRKILKSFDPNVQQLIIKKYSIHDAQKDESCCAKSTRKVKSGCYALYNIITCKWYR